MQHTVTRTFLCPNLLTSLFCLQPLSNICQTVLVNAENVTDAMHLSTTHWTLAFQKPCFSPFIWHFHLIICTFCFILLSKKTTPNKEPCHMFFYYTVTSYLTGSILVVLQIDYYNNKSHGSLHVHWHTKAWHLHLHRGKTSVYPKSSP